MIEMEDKIVLICATGRSGSTTMQRILNTIPNSNICGENYGAINSLLEFYRRIKVTSTDYTGLQPASYEEMISNNMKPAWYNSYDYQQMVQIVKSTIITMFKNKDTTNIWGFKEIRWVICTQTSFYITHSFTFYRYDSGNIHYIEDFKELFPQTKVIIQIRENIQAQSQSSWFQNDEGAIDFLTKTSHQLVQFGQSNKDWCYVTSFEKMFDINHLKQIFEFIGCEENFKMAEINDILKNNLKD